MYIAFARFIKMKHYLYIFLVLCYFTVKSQFLVSSNTSLEFCNKTDSCLSVNNISFLYYDESKNEFFLKVDFSNFRSLPDSIANWVNNEHDTCLFFRMIFPKENFTALSVEERRSFKVNGRIFYSSKWKDQSVQLTLFKSQSNLMNNTSNGSSTGFESYKVNFTLPFIPGDFKKNKDANYSNEVININVTLGRINMLRPGMESLINEVYYQPSR